MGLWAAITGAKAIDKTMDIAEKATNGIIAAGDKMFYTDEEKAETLTKRIEVFGDLAKTNLEFAKATQGENTTRSITRRYVAFAIIANTILVFWTIATAWFFNPQWAKFMMQLAAAFYVGISFLSVVIFFFGNHMINGVVRQFKQ